MSWGKGGERKYYHLFVGVLNSWRKGGRNTLYGERYRGLVLYGSYARGEANEGSDVDLLLLLDGGEEVDPVREILRAEDVKWPLALEADYAVSLLPVSVEDYEAAERPFLWNARREGIRAW